MSKNVAEIFGKVSRQAPGNIPVVQWPLPHQLVGLEIEAERTPNTVFPENYFPFWNRIKDGSLMNGHEYVLAMPLKGSTLTQAIHELYADPARLERCTTGSTHIHLDMFEESVSHETIKLMVLLMYVFESAIFAIADRGREWCGYTNKLTSAPEMLVGAILNASENDNFSEFKILCGSTEQIGRYYGINVMALQKYGSLEFRYFPTASSPEELIDWVMLCMYFKVAALNLGTVDRLIEVLQSDQLYDEFLTTYFTKWKDVFMQELPQIQAITNANKALAVASTQARNRQPQQPFDERAVTNNKILSKFMKNKVKDTFDPIITSLYEDAPDPNQFKVGTPMLHAQRVYLACGYDWLSAPYDDHTGRLTDVIVKKTIKSLIKIYPQIRRKMSPKGHGPGSIMGTADRIRICLAYLCSQADMDMPPMPEILPLEATTAINPVRAVANELRYTGSYFDPPPMPIVDGPEPTEEEIHEMMEAFDEPTTEEGSDE